MYTEYLAQTRRLEAETTLSKLAIAMEKFHIEHNTYQGATLASLNFNEQIAKNNYRLLIAVANDSDYMLTANPLGKQAEKDTLCGQLILYANNKKAITGHGNVDECW